VLAATAVVLVAELAEVPLVALLVAVVHQVVSTP
jgi:hypothetical protein